MKVLILTGSTGGGHNSAARSLAGICNEYGIDSVIYDITAKKDGLRNTPSTPYEKIIKYIPHVYKFVYKSSNNKSVRLLNRLVRESSESLYNAILRHKPDIIVSVHPMSVDMITRYFRKGYDFNIPYIQIIPDLHAHEVYVHPFIDAYITPSEYTNLSVAKRKGIAISKTYDYGNPISDKFVNKYRGDVEFNNTVMILLGSMGYEGNIKKVYDLLDKDTKRTYLFVTGHNSKLKEKLERKYADKISKGKLEVYGFINNIDEIMKRSDLVLTKVGGGSLSECINLRKPMILINPIPGQEQENVRIMNIYDIGIDGSKQELYPIIEDIYNNKEKFNNMIAGLDRMTKNYGKENIINLIKEVYEKHSLKNK